MSIITLTTDFGLKDHFAGALKGRILSQCPEATLIDISHHIDPFNIAEATYIVNAAYSSFPKGSVHLIAVDYELSKENRHIAMEWDEHFFVCADNGIPGFLAQKIVPRKIVEINIHERLPADATDLSVFATVACHIAKGGLLNVVGKETQTLNEFTDLRPAVSDDGNSLKGHIVYTDHFGNLVTNITRQQFLEAAKGRPYEILLGQRQRLSLRTILARYSDIGNSGKFPLKNYESSLLAIFNEAGQLEIAIYRSNTSTVGGASSLLGLGYRDLVTVVFS